MEEGNFPGFPQRCRESWGRGEKRTGNLTKAILPAVDAKYERARARTRVYIYRDAEEISKGFAFRGKSSFFAFEAFLSFVYSCICCVGVEKGEGVRGRVKSE